jgi:hypothetical protein
MPPKTSATQEATRGQRRPATDVTADTDYTISAER